jgi:hypothetical protein
MRKCRSCSSDVEEDRVELLDSHVCAKCAARGVDQPGDIRGFMVYDHKTAPDICIMTPGEFKYAKEMTDRVGQESILSKIVHDNP